MQYTLEYTKSALESIKSIELEPILSSMKSGLTDIKVDAKLVGKVAGIGLLGLGAIYLG